MLKSMTGYGRSEMTVGGRHIIFEIKSVNHKYFEFNSRISRGYLFLEDKLKAYLQGKLSRGKVDVFLQIETLEDADAQVQVNHSLAAGYYAALRALRERYSLPDEPTLALLTRYGDIFSVHRAPENEEEIWQAVQQAAEPRWSPSCACGRPRAPGCGRTSSPRPSAFWSWWARWSRRPPRP